MVPVLTWCSWILNSFYLGTLLFQSDQILSRTRSDVERKAQMVSRVDHRLTSILFRHQKSTSLTRFANAIPISRGAIDCGYKNQSLAPHQAYAIRCRVLLLTSEEETNGTCPCTGSTINTSSLLLDKFLSGTTDLYLKCLSAMLHMRDAFV